MKYLKIYDKFTCSIFDLPVEMREDIQDILLDIEDIGYLVSFDPFADEGENPYIWISKSDFSMDDIKDTVDRIEKVAGNYGWDISGTGYNPYGQPLNSYQIKFEK
jgi:hypothetical protein